MKNVIIFGDSYSTFEDCIPEGYEPYYPRFDVNSADDTWWGLVAKEQGINIVMNNSWSGSTMGYTAYGNSDRSHYSFITRLRQLKDQGFFEKNKIDTVFVFGGTNDSWANAPLGEIKKSDFEEKDFYTVIPALYYFFKLLKEILPNAQVYCLINNELKPEIIDTFLNISKEYNIIPVTFERIDKESGHPNASGMRSIADGLNKAIMENN